MIKIRKDLTGQKFGRLTVIGRAPDYVQSNGRARSMWYCKCDCGNKKITAYDTTNLTTGHTKSCGCYEKEQTSKVQLKRAQARIKQPIVVGDMAICYTAKGEEFYIDSCNLDKISGHNWWITKQGYVTGYVNDRLTLLHRFLTNCDEEHLVDHKNHITWDDRLSNLRICSESENHYNKSMQSNNTSGTVGVSFDKRSGKWRAHISADGKRIELGLYENYDDAVVVRSVAEDKYHKEFSYNNSMKGGVA